jgi:ABC-type uncharacterized transport system ATPase subunit
LNQNIVELHGIVKRFPGVIANNGVELSVKPGTIHAIVGENGSGKSTMMKILYGAQQPDEGEIRIKGELRRFKSARDAIEVGIGMVFQHFMLADNFLVWENIVLGEEPRSGLTLSSDLALKQIRELSSKYGLAVDPEAVTGSLGVGERQRVEILKVLFRGASIIILDEPTAVLVPQEVDELFASLRELVASGVTVIFISHKLDEVLKVADAITVIRAGKTVGEITETSLVTAVELATMMIGSILPHPGTERGVITEDVLLEVEQINLVRGNRSLLADISFAVHSGEIVGIAGVEGNGQEEILEVILGLQAQTSGRVLLKSIELQHVDTRHRRDAGIGYIPADRQRDGLMLSATLWENTALGHQRQEPASDGLWINRAALRTHTQKIIEKFDVRTPGVEVSAQSLSGGNQQKLIVGREMLSSPTVLVAAHPTRGIDVGAQAAVWESLREAKRQGKGLLLVSADLDELIGLSDRLLVMLRGSIVAALDPQATSAAELGAYMTGARVQKAL